MTPVMILEDIASALLVMVCWWLAHQISAGRKRFDRAIAVGYGLLGMTTLGNLLFRHVDDLSHHFPLSVLITKIVLLVTLWLVAMRLDLHRSGG